MKNKTLASLCLFICFLLIAIVSACATRQPSPVPGSEPALDNATAVASGPSGPAASPASDQPLVIPATVAATGWPAAFVSEPVYKFGTVVDGTKIVHEFIIENQGESPLLISEITTGCACAVPEYPRTIFPGDKGKIIITSDTNGYGGREFSRDIKVSTNEPNNAMFQLIIYGQISPFADIAPKSLILKGRTGEKIHETAIITPKKEYPFSITGFELSDELKDVVSIDIDRDNGKYILTAKNKMKSPGQYLGKLVIKTDSSIKPEIKIFIRGIIR